MAMMDDVNQYIFIGYLVTQCTKLLKILNTVGMQLNLNKVILN